MNPFDRELYRLKEKEFMDRTDALCENRRPADCDCSACPCRELCKWLCENDCNAMSVKLEN